MNPGNESIHVWHHCHGCESSPITGRRYHCEACPDGPDNDLCEPCYQRWQRGEIQHPGEDSLTSTVEVTRHHFTVHEGKPASNYSSWLMVPHQAALAPGVPDGFVLRPIFNAGLDSIMGGYAFVTCLEKGGKAILLTALHVMDPLIKAKQVDSTGKNRGYTGKELPAIISGVNIFDVFAANWMLASLGEAGPMLVLPGARTGDEEPYSKRDIAAFFIQDASLLHPVPLATKTPGVGEPVWLVARSQEKPQQKLFKAVVVEYTPDSFVFSYEDEAIPKYSSGTAVLNKGGEVVGIVVGGGKINERRFGHANHVENIRFHLNGVAELEHL